MRIPRGISHKGEVCAVRRISPLTGEIISPYGREFLRPIRLVPFLLPRHPSPREVLFEYEGIFAQEIKERLQTMAFQVTDDG